MSMRALLVDDERLARKRLRELLSAHPEIEIVGEAASVTEAEDFLSGQIPDLIFLDVQMPREDGFQLLPKLPAPPPRIVFVTAHDAYAVRAFEVNALDYLLKPVDPRRLQAAIARLGQPVNRGWPGFHVDDRIMLDDGQSIRFTAISRLAAIEAEGNYTRVHVAEDRPAFVPRGIGDWADALPHPPFLRADRSLIVNLALICEVRTRSRDVAAVLLEGVDQEFPVGRAASVRVKAALRNVGAGFD